jgi:hypothetical protein
MKKVIALIIMTIVLFPLFFPTTLVGASYISINQVTSGTVLGEIMNSESGVAPESRYITFSRLTKIAFANNTHLLASTQFDGGPPDEMRVYNLSNGGETHIYSVATHNSRDAEPSPNGDWIAVGCTWNGSGYPLVIYNVVDWTINETISLPNDISYSLAFSKDNKYLAVASYYPVEEVWIYDTIDWTLNTTISLTTGFSDSLDFSTDKLAIGIWGVNGKVYLYDTCNWTLNTTYSPFDGPMGGYVSAIDYSDNETWLAACYYLPGTDIEEIRIFNATTGSVIKIISTTTQTPTVSRHWDIRFFADSLLVTTHSYDGGWTVNLYNSNTSWSRDIQWYETTGTLARKLAVSPNNRLFAFTCKFGIFIKSFFNVTRTVGSYTESNIITTTAPMNHTGTVLRVPVSSEVTSISNVTNDILHVVASEVNSSVELVNGSFWFDASENIVYIKTVSVTTGNAINWTVNCTYGGAFSINIPSFKTVGDDIVLQGVIKDTDGNGISGIMARTYIYYSNGSIAIGDDPALEWNCTGGNFHTTISTTSLVPGIYHISVEFTDPTTGLTFKKGGVLYLSWAAPSGIYSDAIVIFNIYNTNIGLGLPKETLQVYVNGVRQRSEVYYTYLGESLNISIKDYYNFTLITKNITINKVYTFVDLGITFHEYDFTNMNAEYFYASFLKSGATRWYEKVVASNGQKDFLLPTGSYTIRVYNADNSSYTVWDDTINNSKALLIGTSGVTVIIEGQDVVDEPIEWKVSPSANQSFIIPTKPPAYPDDPFTVLEMYDVLRVTSMPKSDAEITVVFLDTGFSSRTYGDVDLSKIIAGKLPEYASVYDVHGHGTWTSYALASIFATHLKNVRLISFKVFDDSGACSQEQLLVAFDAVKKLNPDIISFSGGGYGGPFDAISKKVEELRESGIVVVVAAGNLGPSSGTILSPAAGEAAICIGAIDPKNTILDRDDDIVTTWSSRGPVPYGTKPDFTAPGESIRGPWGESQATVSGTSMSTPLVAAGMAIMWGNNKGILDFVDMLYFWDDGTIPNMLESAMADTVYTKGSVDDYGLGIPDFTEANDAVYGRAIILISIWFAFIVGIIIVVVILSRRYILPYLSENDILLS